VVATYQLAFFSAVARTGVAVGTVVAIGSAPLLTALVSRLTGGPRIGGRWLAATAGAIAGCAMLVLAGRSGGVDPLGVGLALVAGGSYAVYAVAASRLIRAGLPETGVMGAVFGIGALVLLPVAIASDSAWLGTAAGAAVAGWLAVMTTVVAYLLYGGGLRRIRVSLAATIGLAEPAVATLLGLAVLHEGLSLVAGIGLVLLVASLMAAVLAPDAAAGLESGAGSGLD
jgi:drug/metabolite transporter, DME family